MACTLVFLSSEGVRRAFSHSLLAITSLTLPDAGREKVDNRGEGKSHIQPEQPGGQGPLHHAGRQQVTREIVRMCLRLYSGNVEKMIFIQFDITRAA